MIQNLNDCSVQVAGTGIAKCSNLQKGNPLGGYFIDKGTKLTALTKASLETLLFAGKLHSVVGSVTYEPGDMEDQFATSSTLIQNKTQDAKPTETYKFWKGQCFYNNVKTLESYEEYDFIKVFEKGIELVNYSDTQLKGFDLGMVTIPHYKEQAGSESAETSIKLQYVRPEELHEKRIFYTWDNLDFDISDFKGIYETSINVITLGSIYVILSILDNCNSSRNVTGLIPAEIGSFTLVNGTISTVTLQSDNTIEITFTGVPTGVKLNIVDDINGNFYKSSVETILID
jgi:hypothetical protein